MSEKLGDSEELNQSLTMKELTVRMKPFESKYGTSFEKYRQQWESQGQDQDYSYEFETDYLQWEALFTQYQRLLNS